VERRKWKGECFGVVAVRFMISAPLIWAHSAGVAAKPPGFEERGEYVSKVGGEQWIADEI